MILGLSCSASADAHDIAATYQLTSQPAFQARTPASAGELLDMLRDWHAMLMAAELSSAGQVRVIIPTVCRNNYLAALTGLSNQAGAGESLVAVLLFAQRWTAAVNWSAFETANDDLSATNAYLDPGIADSTGQRLQLPG